MNLDYLNEHRDRVLDLAVQHLQLSAWALLLAMAVALPLGIAVSRFPSLSVPVLGALDLLYTIPTLALLSFLIPTLGIGRQPAILVLAAYAQLSLVRNIDAALRGIDPALLEAARGMGMTGGQALLKVRLPLAAPILLAGVRIAAVSIISLASVTAWVNAGGLGTLLFDGITRDYPSMILAGTIAIVAIALSVDALFRLLERLTPTARAHGASGGRRRRTVLERSAKAASLP